MSGSQYQGNEIFEKFFHEFQIIAIVDHPKDERQYVTILEKAVEDFMSGDAGNSRLFVADYLRSLYQLIDFIDDSNLSSNEKDKYLRIIATSLSHIESTVLAYILAFSTRDYVEEYIILNIRTGFPNFLRTINLLFPNSDQFNAFIRKRMFS